jgi:hypothetical protein
MKKLRILAGVAVIAMTLTSCSSVEPEDASVEESNQSNEEVCELSPGSVANMVEKFENNGNSAPEGGWQEVYNSNQLCFPDSIEDIMRATSRTEMTYLSFLPFMADFEPVSGSVFEDEDGVIQHTHDGITSPVTSSTKFLDGAMMVPGVLSISLPAEGNSVPSGKYASFRVGDSRNRFYECSAPQLILKPFRTLQGWDNYARPRDWEQLKREQTEDQMLQSLDTLRRLDKGLLVYNPQEDFESYAEENGETIRNFDYSYSSLRDIGPMPSSGPIQDGVYKLETDEMTTVVITSPVDLVFLQIFNSAGSSDVQINELKLGVAPEYKSKGFNDYFHGLGSFGWIVNAGEPTKITVQPGFSIVNIHFNICGESGKSWSIQPLATAE